MKPFLSVIIPTYNDVRTLSLVLLSAKEYLEHRGYTYEILIADCGSSDATPEIIRRFKLLVPGVKAMEIAAGATTGEAIKFALASARGAWHGILSAKNTAHIDEFEKAIHRLKSGFDVAVGEYYGLQLYQKFYRIIHNLIVSPVERKICFLSDTASEIVSRAAGLVGDKWLPEMLKLSKQQGLKIKKFPVCYN